ncbi:MAG: hypothetical protein J5758_07030, partial [Abditibacteriota bacterium]|nr:hypothetical protein [Abditibacteriota bacterium]
TGAKTKQALVCGNMSDSPFTVINKAPEARVTISGNVSERFVPDKGELVNYTLDFTGDVETQYINGFQTAEKRFGGMRWSGENAKVDLPVLPDTEYTLYAYVYVPKWAISETSGIYSGETLIIPVNQEGNKTLSGKVKTGKNQKTLRLDIKVKGWKPMDNMEGSTDYRTLGIGLMQLRLESKKGAGTFNFNTRKTN